MRRMCTAVVVCLLSLVVTASALNAQCAGCSWSGNCQYGPLADGYASCGYIGGWCVASGSCGGFASSLSPSGSSLAAAARIDRTAESYGRTVMRDCRGYIAQRLYSEEVTRSVREFTKHIEV